MRQGYAHCILEPLRGLVDYMGYSDAILASRWAITFPKGTTDDLGAISAGNDEIIGVMGLRRAGFRASMVTDKNTDRAWEATRESIDRGMPVVVWTDTSRLPQYVEARWTIRAPHGVLIYGYEDDERAWILDSWSPAPFNGPMTVNDLKLARSAIMPPSIEVPQEYCLNNAYIRIHRPISPTPLVEIARQYIHDALCHADGDATAGYYVGPSAIRHFARIIGEALNATWMREEQRDYIYSVYRALRYVVIERRLGGALLESAFEATGDRKLNCASMRSADVERSWAIARNLFGKTYFSRDIGVLTRLEQRLNDIADAEEQILEDVADSSILGR